MKTLEYTTFDKSKWGPGPWQTEPDKKQWTDEATGFPCLIVRNALGGLCGYVGTPEGHPWHGRDYNDVYARVHGGLTFSDKCADHGEVLDGCDGSRLAGAISEACSICHKVEDGENDNVWWVGFDTSHCDDLNPSSQAASRRLGLDFGSSRETYKDLAYVTAEVQDLAKQARAAFEMQQLPEVPK